MTKTIEAPPRGGLKKPKPTWEERAADLVDFHRVYGRFPRGYHEGESSLYSFLQSQRGLYRAGKLIAARKRYLDERVPGWLTLPKAERERALWKQRAGKTEKFVRVYERYPRYKTAADPQEKVLAVWLSRQLYCLRRGKLGAHRESWLDKHLPTWKVASRSWDQHPAPAGPESGTS